MTRGTGGWRSREGGCGGGAGRLPWEPSLLWVSSLRMPWKGVSSLHLQGDESALKTCLLSGARLSLRCPMPPCLTWAAITGEELDAADAAASLSGSPGGPESNGGSF